jgi:hypothetical protein
MEQEFKHVVGFSTYFVRRDAQGNWSFVTSRKLLGLFRRPDEIHDLRNIRAAEIVRWFEDDGIELREIYLHPHQGSRVLICPQPSDKELAWFKQSLGAAGLPVEGE